MSMLDLDNIVPISDLNHGQASKVVNRVGDNEPIVVMRNNKPAAVIISPNDFKRYTAQEEDFALYLEAVERDRKDSGKRLTVDEVFGKDYSPVDDDYEPEFE